MLARFSSFPHELELLEGNVHDQVAPPNGELAMSRPQGMPISPIFPLDPRPSLGPLIKLKHWPIIIFIKLNTFCCHQVHNHL